jgi:hypothetical protein
MNPNYSDWRQWREVELYKEGREYLSDHQEYSARDIARICSRLLRIGHQVGLKGCFLKFRSHMEPWEDCLNNPSVTVCGYRPLNNEEKLELAREDKVNELAEEKGITPYEARNLLSLMEKGIVK